LQESPGYGVIHAYINGNNANALATGGKWSLVVENNKHDNIHHGMKSRVKR
jgi:hypothetical protein